MRGPVVAIVGPTAVGKSALAEELAVRWSTEVVSVDAMQVYRGMDIGTAKVPVAQRRAPLLLVDVVDPSVNYSAALYQTDARREIDRLLDGGSIPVLCGGTGLYLSAALDEMRFPSGELDTAARRAYERYADEHGAEALHELLASRDRRSAGLIHPHNVRRVVRALEMLDEGSCYADQCAGFSQPERHFDAYVYALTMDRARLYARIDARVDDMMEEGLLAEVRALVAGGAGPALTARQAIGYKELIDYLEGRCTLDDAVGLIKLRSRRYAKRQLSWFRRDDRVRWIDMDALGLDGAVSLIEGEVRA